MIELSIDGKRVTAEEDATVLEAARAAGIGIPTLCYHPGLPPDGNCRLCLVEIERKGKRELVISCMYGAREGLVVHTRSSRIWKARSFVLKMLLERTPDDPLLKRMASHYGVAFEERFHVESDPCIRCGLCVRACEENGTEAIGFAKRGWEREVSAPFEEPPRDCTGCKACAVVCPTGCIDVEEEGDVRRIWGKDFRLVRCALCGERFATEEELAHMGLEGDEAKYCQRCRKMLFSARFLVGL
ncbi:MAG TPA: 2Fe-2S iron-sulfur cluster-binding protein [Thermosynergistes sp.]|nr:2Fe-2S iron-sulfur cluster-binding protein [Thermosynergistes sp.]